jgi:large subunit ribosomal protein L15
MRIDQITRTTENKKKRYVGRGGKRGKTSGRGTKGQNARAGRKKRPELRDIIKKLPKQRGYAFNSYATKPTTVALSLIETHFENGSTVSPATLLEAGVIKKLRGVVPAVKILSKGTLTKKVTVTGCLVSAGVRSAIEKAGGVVQ